MTKVRHLIAVIFVVSASNSAYGAQDRNQRFRFVEDSERYFVDPVSDKCFDFSGNQLSIDDKSGKFVGADGSVAIGAENVCTTIHKAWSAKHPLRSWECVLDEIPSVRNDVSAQLAFSDCTKRYGEERTTVRSFSLFGPTTKAECRRKHADQTPSPVAARIIVTACNALYEK